MHVIFDSWQFHSLKGNINGQTEVFQILGGGMPQLILLNLFPFRPQRLLLRLNQRKINGEIRPILLLMLIQMVRLKLLYILSFRI